VEQQQLLKLEIETVAGQFSKRCRIIDEPALRHVLIDDMPEYAYQPDDKETQRAVVVFLYQRDLATQKQLANGFGVAIRSVRYWISRYRKEGINGLSDKQRSGAPKKVTPEMKKRIFELRERRVKVTEIAITLNLSFGAVCTVLYQSGDNKAQYSLDILDGLDSTVDDSNAERASSENTKEPDASAIEESDFTNKNIEECHNAVKKPWNRSLDRALAKLGHIEDAEPLFPESQRIENAGIFLALASHSMNSFGSVAKKVYVSFGAAFYGIRSVFMMLVMMALLRIKNSEQLGGYNPEKLGVILGLDRSPDVKTLRRKLSTIFFRKKASEFMNALVDSRLIDSASESELATIYIDGHIKSYYGKFKIGATRSATRNRVDKAVTDYWINLSDGTPLLVIPTAFNESMTTVLPDIVQDAKKMYRNKTNTRMIVIFDRGGYSALLFEKLIAMDVDIITYNRSSIAPVEMTLFVKNKTKINNREYAYEPYCRETTLPVYETTTRHGKKVRVDTKRKVVLQEILIRRDDDGITPILTTIKNQSSITIASKLFNRWSQENYFKYMKREFALDHLCTYGTENIPPDIVHPNPEYTKLTKDIARHREAVNKICGKNAKLFLENNYTKIKKELQKLNKNQNTEKLKNHLMQIDKLQNLRKGIKERIVASDFKQLKREGRLFSNAVKIASYYIETELVTLFRKYYNDKRVKARRIIAAMLKCSGTIKTRNGKLVITLEKQGTPLITKAVKKLCNQLSDRKVKYPGTELVLEFHIEQNRQH